mmetsp:Transcript_26222/g.51336  ORF Transcript_26222/g.51336 Transcript_26222/m.51336 type:complete len:211 (+) Transcript_26222:88-720(+)
MQLEVVAHQATGLKHRGKHCLEYRLDGHGPIRTDWVDNEYDYDFSREEYVRRDAKNFSPSSRRSIVLVGSEEQYAHKYLHITVIHQRMITDKRAAEAHVAFDAIKNGFSGWISLEHKDKHAGKIFVAAALKGDFLRGARGRPSQLPSGHLPQSAATVSTSSSAVPEGVPVGVPVGVPAGISTNSSQTSFKMGQSAEMQREQQWQQQQAAA